VLKARETPALAMQTLSPRQLHVLAELARGKSSREIAQHFGVEESTVRTHQNVIYQRLGVKNKTQASAIYWQWSHSLGMDHG
jgi:DNA-binding NarL/FixJ family response regulator